MEEVHFYEKQLFILLAKALLVLIISLEFSYAYSEYKYTEKGPVLSVNLRNINILRKGNMVFKILTQQLNISLQFNLTPTG